MAVRHLETAAKLLKLLERALPFFAKCALKLLDNQADFDSAMPKSPPLLPRQPKVSWMIGQALAQFSKAESNPFAEPEGGEIP
jgi:hypothetical protein